MTNNVQATCRTCAHWRREAGLTFSGRCLALSTPSTIPKLDLQSNPHRYEASTNDIAFVTAMAQALVVYTHPLFGCSKHVAR